MAKEGFYQEAEKMGMPNLGKAIDELVQGQRAFLRRMEAAEQRHDSQDEKIKNLEGAFADGDYDGHRRYHKVLIESLEERRRLRKAIQEKTISGLVWAAIVWLSTRAYDLILKTGGHP